MDWTSPFGAKLWSKNNITATLSTTTPTLTIDNQVFDAKEKKSKQYYSLLIGKKAQLPGAASKLQKEFNFSLDQLTKTEPYMKAIQSTQLYLI